jgi:hypothetical protein
LRKSGCDVGGYFIALAELPVFQVELFADDLESLIEDFTPGSDTRQTGRPSQSRAAVRVSDQSSLVFEAQSPWILSLPFVAFGAE